MPSHLRTVLGGTSYPGTSPLVTVTTTSLLLIPGRHDRAGHHAAYHLSATVGHMPLPASPSAQQRTSFQYTARVSPPRCDSFLARSIAGATVRSSPCNTVHYSSSPSHISTMQAIPPSLIRSAVTHCEYISLRRLPAPRRTRARPRRKRCTPDPCGTPICPGR